MHRSPSSWPANGDAPPLVAAVALSKTGWRVSTDRGCRSGAGSPAGGGIRANLPAILDRPPHVEVRGREHPAEDDRVHGADDDIGADAVRARLDQVGVDLQDSVVEPDVGDL